MLDSRFHAHSMRLVRACEEGSLGTVQSLVPKLYPSCSFTLIRSVPHPRFLLSRAAEEGQAAVLRWLLANLPIPHGETTPWEDRTDWYIHSRAPIKDCYMTDELVGKAVDSRCTDVVQVMLDAGMNVDHQEQWHGYPPLGHAMHNKDLKMIKFLLEKGANPNEKWHGRYSPLAKATEYKRRDIILALMNHGARIPGSGALLEAAGTGDIATAKFLLRMGADVNEVVNLVDTCCESDNCLVEDDEDMDEDDDDDEEIHDEGKKSRDDKELDNEDEEEHETALHAAAEHGEVNMAKWLLRKGARKDLLNGKSETPLDVAKRKGHTKIMQLLEKGKMKQLLAQRKE